MNAQSTLKILLIEENLVNQKVTLYQLKSMGHLADVVSGKQAALDKIAATHYDIILMNCQIPDGDGYTTAQEIRQLEAQPERDRQVPTVIIAMENDLTPDKQAQGLAVGINSYLGKPIRKEELAQELQVWQQRIANNFAAAVEDAQNLDSLKLEADRASLGDLINWGHLQQMSDGNQEFELELLKIFVEDSHQHLARTKLAVELEDFLKLEQEAHHIKGASANVGVKRMQMAAAQLEQMARNHQITGAAELVAEIAEPLSTLSIFISDKI